MLIRFAGLTRLKSDADTIGNFQIYGKNMENTTEPSGKVRFKLSLRQVALVTAIAPLGILLHEVGHFLAYWALGYDASLHATYAGVPNAKIFWQAMSKGDLDAARGIMDIQHAALGTGSAICVSYLMIVVGVLGVRRFAHEGLSRVAFCGLALTASVRFLLISMFFPFGFMTLADEAKLAMAIGIPAAIPVFVGFLFMLLAFIGSFRFLPTENRVSDFGNALIGVIVGNIAYGILGPIILP